MSVTKERDESILQFSVSQEHVLANLKLILVEWIEKADNLEGKLVMLQGCWNKTNAGLDLEKKRILKIKLCSTRSTG